ncbi:unnamed protein product [Pieris brassicae]|uniref:Uncharacterized protein n=1 Tax=Pieris brassicae TaxID=7116 RepID=A0A9P0TRZ4_PIEBR|nr:unnamed protein product [Pieris brassicae]
MHDDNFLLGYRIREVDATAYYVSQFITEAEEKNILSNVYGVPKPKWTQLSNRRLQNWGGIPHNKGMIAETIPMWLNNYLLKIDKLNVMNGNKPNHILKGVVLGVYEEGEKLSLTPAAEEINQKSGGKLCKYLNELE